MEIDWLRSIADGWLARAHQGRLPHAALLLGAPGSGKRSTAVWMAKHRLGIHDPGPLPQYPIVVPDHADLRWIRPPEDKHTVGVDQVRTLIDDLSLTSYEGKGKVAVIDSAHAMTSNAANSLLKTLEEPPGDALIILVADRVGRLPATVFSRCQRINFTCPATADSLAWLDRLQPGTVWAKPLRASGGAPLAAIAALDLMSDTQAMSQAFADLAAHTASPLAVAAQWAKYEPRFVLDWLCAQIQSCIYRHSGFSGNTATGHIVELADSVLHRIDRRNLFCYLDTINRLRAQAPGSFNVHLAFEGLLIDWSEGLSDVQRPGSMQTAQLSFSHG